MPWANILSVSYDGDDIYNVARKETTGVRYK